jgi:hypothetical protein
VLHTAVAHSSGMSACISCPVLQIKTFIEVDDHMSHALTCTMLCMLCSFCRRSSGQRKAVKGQQQQQQQHLGALLSQVRGQGLEVSTTCVLWPPAVAVAVACTSNCGAHGAMRRARLLCSVCVCLCVCGCARSCFLFHA